MSEEHKRREVYLMHRDPLMNQVVLNPKIYLKPPNISDKDESANRLPFLVQKWLQIPTSSYSPNPTSSQSIQIEEFIKLFVIQS